MADAQALKDEGNRLFQEGSYLKAAGTYTQAIKLDPENAVLYSNRSAALLKLKKITKALEDAETCIKLRPDWEKGYFRKGAVLEDQQNLGEALEVYRTASQLCPDNQELASKLRTLNKLVKHKANTDSKASSTASTAATQATKTVAPPPPAAAAAAAAVPVGPGGEVYEDMGSEEVAKFTEEYLADLAAEIQEEGTSFIPTIHILPGPQAASHDEQQEHIRGAGAWETPQTLTEFVAFLRTTADKLDAQAVLALVPKQAIGYPQTWQRPSWPCGGADGVFAQLDAKQVQRCWFVPVSGKSIGTPQPVNPEDFGPMPRIIRV